MGQTVYDSWTLGGLLTSGTETTSYSNKMFNGSLIAVELTTNTATTGTLSTTGAILLKGAVTGIVMAKFQLGTPPTRMHPLVSCASSSGALLSALTTGYSWGDRIPLANERLCVQTSGGSSAGGFCYTVKAIVDGFGTT